MEGNEPTRADPFHHTIWSIFYSLNYLASKTLDKKNKVAWSVPVEFGGRHLTIEHRKFGLGIFSENVSEDEGVATEIVKRVQAGVKAAQPFFDYLAETAARGSGLNVVNRARELFDRFKYLADRYESKRSEAEARKDETVETKHKMGVSYSFPSFSLGREAQWYALSAVEAFFSWTEHVFIHLGIIAGGLTTGQAVSKMADANWAEKFKVALDLSDVTTKNFYDRLLVLRRQLRNFVAHGSFGKDGEAFSFHSSVGAVPLLLPHSRGSGSFKFGNGVDFLAHDAITLIRDFIEHLWSGSRAPAKIYIQECGLPLILTMAVDGTYAQVMGSEQDMRQFADYQMELADRYANMDF